MRLNMKTIYDIKIGDKESYSKTMTDADVVLYSCMTGDFNPEYINDAFAKKGIYGQRIVQDMLVAGLILTIIGTRLPGPGNRCIRQTLDFLKPVYIGDTITASVQVTECYIDSKQIVLSAQCVNQDMQVVICGEVLIDMTEKSVHVSSTIKKASIVRLYA